MISVLRGIRRSGTGLGLGSHPIDHSEIIPKIIIVKKIVSHDDEIPEEDKETPEEDKEILVSTKEKIVPS